MPFIKLDAFEFDMPRNAAIVDTNALVALVDTTDRFHEEAVDIFENDARYEWLVLPAVITEACGLLTSRKKAELSIQLLRWVVTPGNAIALPSLERHQDLLTNTAACADIMQRFRVDLVDTYLLHVAEFLTDCCSLRPHAPILTGDTRDFYILAKVGHRFSLYDLKSPHDELVELTQGS